MVGEMFWLMVTVAVAGGLSIPILAIWTRHRKDIAAMEAEAATRLSGETAAQNRELEHRVRVLERIVTDKGFDVSHQIEQLREERELQPDAATGRGKAIN